MVHVNNRSVVVVQLLNEDAAFKRCYDFIYLYVIIQQFLFLRTYI